MAFPADSFTDATDFALNRTGLTDAPAGGSAGANKLWLPLWSGEVINAYDQFNVFENLVTTKSLSGGFSYEFPVTGTIALNPSWDAGEELGGGSSTSTTFKVNLDKRPMAAHFECDNVDLLVTQWDYRSELARQAGLTLANTRDRQIAVSICAAALLSPLGYAWNAASGSTLDPRGLDIANFPAPAVVDTTTSAPGVAVAACTEVNALKILEAIENYMVFMQTNDYPTDRVICAVPPKVFQVIRGLGLTRSADVLTVSGNTNFTSGTNFTKNPMFGGSAEYGGLGAPYTMGMNSLSDTLQYMGCTIIKSNHLPVAKNYSSANIGSAKYNLDFSEFNVFGVIFQPEAVAGLSLMGMKVDTVQDVRRNTQFTVASMMKGTGVLRPELCQLLVGTTNDTDADASSEIDTRGELAGIVGTNLQNGFAAEYAVTA
jgi:hypothetical protein